MRHFFTKAIVCAGVMASALALNGMAVFATINDTDTEVDTLVTTGASVGDSYNYGSCTYDTVSEKAVYTWDFNGFNETGAKVYGMNYSQLQASNGGAKLAKDGGYFKFTTDGQFDLKVTGDGTDTKINGLSFGTAVDGGKGAGWDDISNTEATVHADSAGTYYIYRGNGGNVTLATITISVYAEESASDKYVWAVSTANLTGDFASISADDFSVTPSTDKQSATITYKGSAFSTTSEFPTTALTSTSSIVTTTSTDIAGTTFKSYTYTINLSDSMFEEYVATFKVASPSVGKIDFTKDMTDPDPDATKEKDGNAKYEDGTILKDYFLTTGGLVYRKAPCVQTAPKGTGNLYFELSESTDVKITFNTTGNKNVSDLAVKNSETQENVSAIALSFGSDSSKAAIGGSSSIVELIAYNLPAGKYEIYSPCVTKTAKETVDDTADVEVVSGITGSAINRGARIYDVTFSAPTTHTVASTLTKFDDETYYCVDKDITYLVHAVSESDLSKDTITGPDGTPSEEVYTEVVFSDQSSVTAESIGADYIYAIAVSDAGRAPIKTLTWTLK